MTSAGEETLAITVAREQRRRLPAHDAALGRHRTRMEGRSAELEFVTALEGENMQDRLAYLSELPPVPDEREVSFRLLLHYASTVRHQKYHGVDVVTVNVEGQR